MIANDSRGHAWTNALLGLQADEIHLCGDSRAHNLIKKLCERTKDTYETKEYKRLSKLNVEHHNITSLKDLRVGDCIVAFSRQKLFTIKDAINQLAPKMAEKEQRTVLRERDHHVKLVEEMASKFSDSGQEPLNEPNPSQSGNFCSIIYGALPPEAKKQQAL